MTDRTIAVDRPRGGPARAALLVDRRLEDLYLDAAPGDALPAPESVHWARVERVVPGLGAAFLRLGNGAEGWLRAPDLRSGTMLAVQVTRWAEPHKAVPVTERVLFKGRTAILTPGAPGANIARGIRGHEARARLEALAAQAMAGAPEGSGLILRTAAAEASDDEVLAEVAALRAVAADTMAAATGTKPLLLLDAPDAAARAFRDWADPAPSVVDAADAFERLGVWDAVEALRSPVVALPGGGRMSIEATRAVVAVDVDTAADFGKTAAATANLAACAELPRQLRLRGLGGVVLVDFAPVKKGARQGIENALKRGFAADPVETTLGGWTPLGHFEMVRKRERRPLVELLPAHG